MALSLRNKLILAVCLPLLAVYLAVLVIDYRTGRAAAIAQTERYLTALTGKLAMEIDRDLAAAAQAARSTAAALSDFQPRGREQIDALERSVLATNRTIFGTAVAYEPGAFAAALMYFTGSKEHNTALRGRAKRMGLKLNEYGLFREDDEEQKKPLAAKNEADLYRHLGLAYIPPELREDMGEIEAAEKNALPTLIEASDILGVLHCHTTYSDGKLSVEQLARACQERGYKYLAICDHSQSAAYAGGLSPDRLKQQWDEIDKVNDKLKGFKIFKGIESDILAEGELDYRDDILARFDLVVASIHSRMTMDRDTMTRRICRAIEHPATRILGHPTGRLLLQREPFDVDIERVIETAAKNKVVIEINAHPMRLDLDWRYIRQAHKAGCQFAINPDAHSEADLDWIPLGVGIARKGWLEAEDVINSMNSVTFTKWIEGRCK